MLVGGVYWWGVFGTCCIINAPLWCLFFSWWGVAGIWVQKDERHERVVAYFSRQTTRNKRKFHTFELEAMAIVASVKRLIRQYLQGRNFTIMECAAVKYAFRRAEVNSRIGRWVVALSAYIYTFA